MGARGYESGNESYKLGASWVLLSKSGYLASHPSEVGYFGCIWYPRLMNYLKKLLSSQLVF